MSIFNFQGDSMHSHDRTLLANLGFADKDKKDPLHDLACSYLAEKEQAERFFSVFPSPLTKEAYYVGKYDDWRSATKEEWEKATDHKRMVIEANEKRELYSSETEVVLSKGEGKYKTIIGFLDVRLLCAISYDEQKTSVKYGKVEEKSERIRVGRYVIAEVKIAECSASDIQRQLKLYQEFVREMPAEHIHWVAAVAFPVTEQFVETLKSDNIRVIALGDKFRAWAETKRNIIAKPEDF